VVIRNWLDKARRFPIAEGAAFFVHPEDSGALVDATLGSGRWGSGSWAMTLVLRLKDGHRVGFRPPDIRTSTVMPLT
jgi:hypothetical protein